MYRQFNKYNLKPQTIKLWVLQQQITTKWAIDPTHSEVSFSKALGDLYCHRIFKSFEGSVKESEDFDGANISFVGWYRKYFHQSTDRDNHLKSADFWCWEISKNVILWYCRKYLGGWFDDQRCNQDSIIGCWFGGVWKIPMVKQKPVSKSKVNHEKNSVWSNAVTEAGSAVSTKNFGQCASSKAEI